MCVQVLGHLPASVQMELLGKLREQRVYENRRTFERASENPNAFSQLQMQSYLKGCKFKRKVANVIVRRPVSPRPSRDHTLPTPLSLVRQRVLRAHSSAPQTHTRVELWLGAGSDY